MNKKNATKQMKTTTKHFLNDAIASLKKEHKAEIWAQMQDNRKEMIRH